MSDNPVNWGTAKFKEMKLEEASDGNESAIRYLSKPHNIRLISQALIEMCQYFNCRPHVILSEASRRIETGDSDE